MQEREENEQPEKLLDIKGTFEAFIEEEKPELSQEEEIKAYREGKEIKSNKKRKNKHSQDDEENEDDEHLKRVKKELLASLERVDIMSHKIFDEKEKDKNLKNIKLKSNPQKSKDREQVIEQMREKMQEDQERSRE